jgi:DNA-binding NtrC family response regulator
MRSRILFISGRTQDARRLTQMLNPLDVVFDHVEGIRHARAQLRQESYHVILTEAALPDGYWLDVLQLARQAAPEPQVIVTDVNADARFWAEALNLGAFDLLVQPFDESEVRRILDNACSRPQALHAAAV